MLLAAVLLGACRTVTPTPAATELAGVEWRLIDLHGAPAIGEASARPTLTFEVDSLRVSGNFGCNRGGGSFTTTGDHMLQFSPITMTRRACIDERMNVQETAFAAAVQATDRYRIVGDTLELRQSDRVLARLVR